MSYRRKALAATNVVLNAVGAHLLPLWEYRSMRKTYYGPQWEPPPIAESDRVYLDLGNPRLAELRRRYEKHPAAAHTQWSEANLLQDLALERFRGENNYYYQVRYSPSPQTYLVTAHYVRDTDRLGLFGRLTEDGMFGAYTVPFENGYLVSRDLLDSINQINVINRLLGRTSGGPLRLLDIGAGYGRLAHRLAEALPEAEAVCTDGVPISTFLCEFYIRFRGVQDRVRVVPLDEVQAALTGQHFSLVTNIHSFSECRKSVIAWWLDTIARVDVGRMLIVPNLKSAFQSVEDRGSEDFFDLFGKFGWRLTHKEPIYAASKAAQSHALYPHFCFYWFERP